MSDIRENIDMFLSEDHIEVEMDNDAQDIIYGQHEEKDEDEIHNCQNLCQSIFEFFNELFSLGCLMSLVIIIGPLCLLGSGIYLVNHR